MLIETDSGGKGEIGTDPYKHSSPAGVLDIEVVLIDPTRFPFQVPTVVFPDGSHDHGGLTRFDNDHNLIGSGTSEIAIHEIVSPSWRISLNGHTPFLGAVQDPIVILRGDIA